MQYTQFIGNLVKGTPPMVKHYCNDMFLILKPDFYIDFVESLNNCYNFSLTFYNNAPPLTVDNKTFNMAKKSMLAINPNQLIECHPENRQLYGNSSEKEYVSIFIEKKYLENISYEISGKSCVLFDNITTTPDTRIFDLLDVFMKEYDYKQIGSLLALDSISNQISIEIIRSVPNNVVSKCTDKEYSSREEINRVIEYMHENSTENITLNELCNIAHLSPFYLIKIFKSYTGKTPHEYFLDIKFERARKLLKQRKLTITEIAYTLGFSSQSYFSSQFKERAGCTPIEFQFHI